MFAAALGTDGGEFLELLDDDVNVVRAFVRVLLRAQADGFEQARGNAPPLGKLQF